MGGQPLPARRGLKQVSGWRLRARWALAVAHPDPLTRAANVIALMLAGNQPFYPLTLAVAVGGPWWQAWTVMLAMPCYVAVLPLSRRAPCRARALMVATSIANVAASSLLLGGASGLSVLFLPCAGLAAMLFRTGERAWMLALVGLSIAGWLLAAVHPAPLLAAGPGFDPAQYAAMTRLNAISALALFGFLGMVIPVAAARPTESSATPD